MKQIVINFKEDRFVEEFLALKPKLTKVACHMAEFILSKYNVPFVITDVWREDKESEHCYYRALDARSAELTKEQIKCTEDYINALFVYDVKRPEKRTCSMHDAGLGPDNEHFHVKVWIN